MSPIRHNFKAALKGLEKDFGLFEQRKSQLVRAVALGVHRDITQRSPVDEGRFRASHYMTTGEPSAQTATDGQSFEAQAEANIGDGTATVAAAIGRRMPRKLDIWIANNLPYAMRLEDGWSKQAPNGVYEIARDKGERMIAKAKRELGL